MGLYTFVVTVELEDDTEASTVAAHVRTDLIAWSEVVEHRWYHDLDAELLAAVAGVEWGGR